MRTRAPGRRLTAVLATTALALTGATAAATTSSAAATASDKTSAVERHRVDDLPLPKVDWFDCSDVVGPRTQCGTVRLPLDYDKPKGATTEVALLRLKVKDPKKKVGTLFLNPGGPGGSGVQIAAAASQFLSPALLEKFDVVGFDPRGTNFSDDVRCFKNLGAQASALKGMNVAFPYTSAEKTAYLASSAKLARGCSTTGKPLSAAMSTAQVARDMDELRRVVGDKKLTYLGFSYGTYLGDVYANLFPDRVRAVTLDGVVDPLAWSGAGSTSVPTTTRLRSGEGAYKALTEILHRCKKAGPDLCQTAQLGDPETVFAKLVTSLKKKPVVLRDDDGAVWMTIAYPDLIGVLLAELYAPQGWMGVDGDVSWFYELTHMPTTTPAGKAKAEKARASLVAHLKQLSAAQAARERSGARLAKKLGFGFPYDNSPEAFQTVLCTDGRNPSKPSTWKTAAAYADVAAPGFGPLWTWASAPCASSTWTARDEDAYTGSFTHRTSAPVLVVGNYWDPATNYDSAVHTASLLKNARLLSSDSWGHTAYGTSTCVTGAVDAYLLSGKLPKNSKVCKGDDQPFVYPEGWSSANPSAAMKARGQAVTRQGLPPVVPPIPDVLPRF
ncbi:alpha/beta hydrolase [Cellulomonas sp. HZM]|uniref:alpha/beta hydrolase n=1 Tax=Cellulomonas sp. HZM TaxID=1454010 RepID=UPI0004938EF8|nr:alpha/beta hydrolase [Cellulomonas sp. HZM]